MRSALNPNIEQLDAVGRRYGCQIFATVEALLAAGLALDGVVVGASHHAHFGLAMTCLSAGLAVFMEKPMTVCIKEAATLVEAVRDSGRLFMVNNTANWRAQTRTACDWVASGRIGTVRHVSCAMGSPLLWLFEDAANEGWVRPSGKMLGNGMCWGQLSHTLSWVLRVTGLAPRTVYCEMGHSEVTGADLYDAAIIRCEGGAIINMQGVGTTVGDPPPTDEDGRPSGKTIENTLFGTEGMLSYGGRDHQPTSGALELRRHDGANERVEGFDFEEGDQEGLGPLSLQAFVAGCRGDVHVWNGCDVHVGYLVVAVLEAMYRSAELGRRVDVAHPGKEAVYEESHKRKREPAWPS